MGGGERERERESAGTNVIVALFNYLLPALPEPIILLDFSVI